MSQPQTKSSPPSNQIYKTANHFIKHCEKLFIENPEEDVYLDDNALKQLGFQRARIDYKTGTTDDGSPQVLKPKPFHKLGVSNTEASKKYFEELAGYMEGLSKMDNFHTGRMMAFDVQDLLQSIRQKHSPDEATTKDNPYLRCG